MSTLIFSSLSNSLFIFLLLSIVSLDEPSLIHLHTCSPGDSLICLFPFLFPRPYISLTIRKSECANKQAFPRHNTPFHYLIKYIVILLPQCTHATYNHKIKPTSRFMSLSSQTRARQKGLNFSHIKFNRRLLGVLWR